MITRISLPNSVAVAVLSLAIAQTTVAAATGAATGANPVPDTSGDPVQTLGIGHVPIPTLDPDRIAAAPDVPGSNPLDRPIVDLALVDGGPGVPPLLVTIDTADLPGGTVRVSLLRRAAGWEVIGSKIRALSGSTDAAETPWLIELGPGSFALVSVSHALDTTTLLPVRVRTPGSRPNLELGEPVGLAAAVDDAGAIDVDGDGGNELVVAMAATHRGDGVCQSSSIRVLDGSSFAPRAEWPVPDMRLAGGALGEWDGRPGGDLLAYVYGNCPAGPDSVQRLGIIAIRLLDGSPISAMPPMDPRDRGTPPGVPLVADLDGDGRNEVVIRDGASLVLLEPARDWARSEISRGDVLPVIAAGPVARGDAGTLVWINHERPADGLVISVGMVTRSPDGSFAITADELDLAEVAPDRRARLVRSMRDLAVAQAPPQGWRGDIDGDRCQEILAPLLTVECDGDPAGADVVRIGALWFATRPVALYDVVDNRELLVAASVEWGSTAGGPVTATPAASGAPGAWRHGPSSSFALSEVRASDAIYFGRYPVPRPTIERIAVRGQATDFPGFTGARVLVRVTGTRPDDPPPAEASTLSAFLSDPPAPGELVTIVRIPVPTGAESGRDGSFVRVSLADLSAADGRPAEGWIVTIAQLNDWGEIAGPIRAAVERDLSGPSLAVEVPFLSPPWPLEATVSGRSEPDVEIRGGSDGRVTTDGRGGFEIRTRLAPWPQTVELTAIDESGNATTMRFSLVGGVDYRAFPWPAILVLTMLLGAAFSTAGRLQPIRDVRYSPEDDPAAEMEDLPVTRWPPA